MTNELIDLFDEAKRIINKQEELIKMQMNVIKTMLIINPIPGI